MILNEAQVSSYPQIPQLNSSRLSLSNGLDSRAAGGGYFVHDTSYVSGGTVL